MLGKRGERRTLMWLCFYLSPHNVQADLGDIAEREIVRILRRRARRMGLEERLLVAC